MNTLPKINSKADAMAYAIEKADGDLEKAGNIYLLFAENIELPETEAGGNGERSCIQQSYLSLSTDNSERY